MRPVFRDLVVVQKPPIIFMTVFRTEVLNAVMEILQELQHDKDLRVATPSGVGDSSFVAGTDMHEFLELATGSI